MRIEANIEFRPYSWLMGYSGFKLPRESRIDVTYESLPCETEDGKKGLCEKQKCVPVTDNPHLKAYEDVKPINGSYMEPKSLVCLALTDDINAKCEQEDFSFILKILTTFLLSSFGASPQELHGQPSNLRSVHCQTSRVQGPPAPIRR